MVLIINSEYRHNLAESDKKGDKDYSSRRKTCEAISEKLGVQWLRELSWEELEGELGEGWRGEEEMGRDRGGGRGKEG